MTHSTFNLSSTDQTRDLTGPCTNRETRDTRESFETRDPLEGEVRYAQAVCDLLRRQIGEIATPRNTQQDAQLRVCLEATGALVDSYGRFAAAVQARLDTDRQMTGGDSA